MTGNYGGQGRGNITLFNVIATPLIIVILASILLITNLVGLIGVLVNGGEIVYEEENVNTYTSNVYKEEFGKAEGKNAKDSGVVVMFFYNEDTNIWEHTVNVGSNVRSEIKNVFSGESSPMVTYLTDNVKTDSNSADFVKAVTKMMPELANKIEEYDLTSPFTKNNDLTKMPVSKAVLTPLGKANEVLAEDGTVIMSVSQGEELSLAMIEFTNATGIPFVMTIDTSVNAFGRTIPTTDIFMVVLLVLVVALCVFSMVKKIREFNRIKNDFAGQDPLQPEGGIKVNARSPYYDEDDEDEVVVNDFESVDEEDAEEEESVSSDEADTQEDDNLNKDGE